MYFDDEIDDIMDEADMARRMLSRKDQMKLANEFIKATICEELSIGGFENPTIGALQGVRDALKVNGFAVSLELGKEEPIITIRKQNPQLRRRRRRWIDRR